MSWYVYMARCADGTLYTGITIDVGRRLLEHNGQNGKGAKYTRVRRPVTLVYQVEYSSRSTAAAAEALLKKQSRQQKLTLIE